MENKPGMQSPYGPLRTATTLIGKVVDDASRQHQIVTEKGFLDIQFGMWFMRQIVNPIIQETDKRAKKEEGAWHAQAQTAAYAMPKLMTAYGHYVTCGRQIFEFTPDRIASLVQAKIGETTLEGLVFPCQAFFVRFGLQQALSMSFDEPPLERTKQYVDGAYVSVQDEMNGEPPALLINFTMVLESGIGLPIPGPWVVISGACFKLPIAQAIDQAVNDLRVHGFKLLSDLQKEAGSPLASVSDGFANHADETANLVRMALPLVINALRCLSEAPLANPTPGSDTPDDLRRAIEAPNTAKAGRKAAAQLPAFGFSMVRLV